MSTFFAFFRLGFEQFLDPQRYDALLFVVALCAMYALSDGRRLLGLAVAFAAGHSLTLVLGTLQLVTVSDPFVEALTAFSVLFMSLLGIWQTERGRKQYRSASDPARLKYGLAAGFGLVHGFVFASMLQPVLAAEPAVLMPLLGFNAGLEAGLVLVVVALLLLSLLLVRLARMEAPSWTLVLLGATGGLSLLLLLERLPALWA